MEHTSEAKTRAAHRLAALLWPRQRTLALVLALALGPALALNTIPTVQAAGITVDNTCSLVDAIKAANSDMAMGGCAAGSGADTITLPGGTISLSAADNTSAYGGDNGLPVITSPITIDGNGSTIARDITAPLFRLFEVASAGDLTLTDTIITGGHPSFNIGGGIYNEGTLTLTNSTVSNNTAYNSGGIYNVGTLNVTNSTVSGNDAEMSSGGTKGGGIGNVGTLTLTNSTISGNTSSDAIGGIDNTGTLTVTNSTISGNTARNSYGGIYNEGTLTVINSTLTRNTAGSNGGGITNRDTLTVTNSTLSGNTAGSNGGGISNDGTLTVTNSTLTGNRANTGGGGIFNSSNGTVTLDRNLIAGNSAPSGQEIRGAGKSRITHESNLFGHSGETDAEAFSGFSPDDSDISATSDGSTPTALTSILDTTLQNNGGSTKTHALVTDSPALDAVLSGPDTDQRGVSRPQGCGYDIGAFELDSSSCTPVPTSTHTSTPTNTPTNTPVPTSTPTSTPTSIPTNTPVSTNTPVPTSTPTVTPVPRDHYADAVAAGTSPLILNPANAVGAPDGAAATVVSVLNGRLVLDMGAGEEGTGNLTVYYRGLSVGVVTTVDFLDASGNVLSSGSLHLVNVGVGTHTAVVTYSAAPTPYRFVRLRAVLLSVYHVDAIEAASIVP